MPLVTTDIINIKVCFFLECHNLVIDWLVISEQHLSGE